MIELKHNQLVVRFPDVHPKASMRLEFQRTLRIPDDGKQYPLPPGLGRFTVLHVDDHAARVPGRWIEHGGVMLPMYQSEAMWINFHGQYPFALKVSAGKINAVTGKAFETELRRHPQDYLVVPNQPWLDGYCVEKGVIRQFVAMPLGSGYSAEEQLTGEAEFGGVQIVAHPMKRMAYERLFGSVIAAEPRVMSTGLFSMTLATTGASARPDMGIGAGGRMRQEIFEDRFDLDDWELGHSSRCFVHIANSLVWRAITGESPPTPPPTAREYAAAELPWFDYYAEGEKALDGSGLLQKVKSVFQLGKEKGDAPLPENEPVQVEQVVALRKDLTRHQVREGTF